MAKLTWTVMVYLAGDNNLSEECVYILKEMKKIGTKKNGGVDDQSDVSEEVEEKPSKFNLIVEFDPAGRGNETRRFRIRGAGGDGTVECDEIPPKGASFARRRIETETSVNTILDFLCDSIEDFPAERYMVVLSGHAAAADPGFLLLDEERPLSLIPTALSTSDLKSIFSSPRLRNCLDGKKIDILGLDACMMSVVEVCYELRNSTSVDLFVASEGFNLNAGWPYERISQHLIDHPTEQPNKLACFIAKEFVEFYRDYYLGGLSVDISVIKLNQIVPMKNLIDALADALIKLTPKVIVEDEDAPKEIPWSPFLYALVLAHWEAQSYNGEQCVDLNDFCVLLKRHLDRIVREDDVEWGMIENAKAACKAISDAFEGKTIIVKSCYSGAAFQYSHGLSIYFPWSAVNLAPSYQTLDFAHDSKWFDFISKYTAATQRPFRTDKTLRGETARSTPPYSKGPEGRIFSMRNPPTKFLLSECLKKVEEGDCEDNSSTQSPSNSIAKDKPVKLRLKPTRKAK